MPSIYCHYISGVKTLEKIKSEKIRSIVEKHRDVFNLGTQGADIFFYYDSWPFKPSSSPKKLGGRIHTKKVLSFFQSALDYTVDKSGRDRDILLAYLFGYICHYSLDGNVHPFVFYRSGFALSEKDKAEYTYYHRRFETALDVLMLSRILGQKPRDVNPSRLIAVNCPSKKTVADMYSFVLGRIYGLEVLSSVIESAISSTVFLQKLLYSKSGLKKRLLESLESLSGNFHLVSSTLHPQTLDEDLDYLNIENSSWSLPWDSHSVRTDSFLDMFEESVTESSQLCEEFYSAVQSNSPIALSKPRWNNSFYTGVDCDQALKFKYFKLIF